MTPKVSFIVPCYNLAHLLPDCLNSILSQTYVAFEVLIMDDCSPDHTPEVARSFNDSRIRYVRNETNLGNIRNYNKGIELSRGEHIWLISADDHLRRDYVLARYVQCLEEHPEVGYVFCPAVAIQDGQESGVMISTAPVPHDTVFKGTNFLCTLLEGNCVSAPSAMARKVCYDRVSLFPLDMPYAGDWFLWCMFALYYNVAYFAEPMVNRRMHDRNLTKFFMTKAIQIYTANMIEVPWQIRYRAEAAGEQAILRKCRRAIAAAYVEEILANQEQDPKMGMTLSEFEHCLQQHARTDQEQSEICARVYTALGDHYSWKQDEAQASQYYLCALRARPRLLSVQAKYMLSRLGKPGVQMRAGLGTIQRLAKAITSF